MSHQDARCAQTAETVVVAAGGSLPSVAALAGKPPGGSPGGRTGDTAWTLTGLAQMSLVGRVRLRSRGALVQNALTSSGGDLYIRNVTFTVPQVELAVCHCCGKADLDHVTTTANAIGLSCAPEQPSPRSALSATGNTALDITTATCSGVTSCGTASTTCGRNHEAGGRRSALCQSRACEPPSLASAAI